MKKTAKFFLMAGALVTSFSAVAFTKSETATNVQNETQALATSGQTAAQIAAAAALADKSDTMASMLTASLLSQPGMDSSEVITALINAGFSWEVVVKSSLALNVDKGIVTQAAIAGGVDPAQVTKATAAGGGGGSGGGLGSGGAIAFNAGGGSSISATK